MAGGDQAAGREIGRKWWRMDPPSSSPGAASWTSLAMAAERRADLPACTGQVVAEERLAVPYIPDDLIFNILARLPVKSVIRFKSVSKAWFSLLSSRCFVNAHLEFSKTRPMPLVVPTEYHVGERGNKTAFRLGFYKYDGGNVTELVHSEYFPGGIAQLVQLMHCDGMVLICTQEEGLMVCNPATREFVCLLEGGQIGNLPHAVGFGRDPCTNEYKVVRFFFERKVGTPDAFCSIFEVLTLGTNVWRRVVGLGPPCMIDMPSSFHIRGFIYWAPQGPLELVCFSLADETFSKLPYPPCKIWGQVCFDILESELCCICVPKASQALEIWICSNTDIPTWTRRFTLQLPQDIVVFGPTGYLRPPMISFIGKSMLIRSCHKMYQYNSQTKEMKKAAVQWRRTMMAGCGPRHTSVRRKKPFGAL